ncbi:MAG: hypothetical protein E7180_03290 [Erysipelotrichaceae bacterium]|nr:hypothetical protein [Erysipelotrichaceae bacterium]
MKKRILLASLLCLGALVGCGNDNNPSSSVNNPSSEEISSEVSSEEVSSEEVSSAYVGEGTKDLPYTVSEICALCDSLAEGAVSDATAYVVGSLVKVTYYNEKYNSYTAIITDGEKEFTLYSANLAEGIAELNVGDELVAHGYYTLYQGKTYEFTGKDGSYPLIDSATAKTYKLSSKVVDENGNASTNATVNGLANQVTSGTPASFTLTVKEGYVATVTLNGQTITATSGTYSVEAYMDSEVVVKVTERQEVAGTTTFLLTGHTLEANAAKSGDVTPFFAVVEPAGADLLSVVTITAETSGANCFGFYSNYRLYTGSTLTIDVKDGYVISGVELVNFVGNKDSESSVSVTGLATDATATKDSSNVNVVVTYENGVSQVVIANTSESEQVRFDSLKITVKEA